MTIFDVVALHISEFEAVVRPPGELWRMCLMSPCFVGFIWVSRPIYLSHFTRRCCGLTPTANESAINLSALPCPCYLPVYFEHQEAFVRNQMVGELILGTDFCNAYCICISHVSDIEKVWKMDLNASS